VVADAPSRIAYTQGGQSEVEQRKADPQQLNIVEMRLSASTEWLNDVQNGYAEDAIFGPILQYLSNTGEEEKKKASLKKTFRIQKRAKTYTLKEDLLFHKPSGGKLCIPKSMRADVVREAHDAILGSRQSGIAKTAAVVGSPYYWPKLTDSIAEWIAGCDACHRIKHKNARPYGLLQPLPIPLERAKRVNIDFVTKLSTSEAGHDAVATITNPLTKRAWWIPVKEAYLTAEKFATAFIDCYVRLRGLPELVVSDWDTWFTSGFWQSLCSQLRIRLRMSTAYHPQSDGQAEKANATLETFLKAYIAQLKSPE